MSGSSDKTTLEQNTLIVKGFIEKYERDVAEGKSMTEEQNKFYQSQLEILQKISDDIEQMNKQQRSWYTNVLKTSGAGQSIW
jgi:SNF2 family DNA or RNA helicase